MSRVTEGESPRDRLKRLEAERLLLAEKQAARDFKATLDDVKESNADYQRTKLMTHEQRVRRAKEQMIIRRKEYNDFTTGLDTTYSRAEKEVNELIHKYHRDQGWE